LGGGAVAWPAQFHAQREASVESCRAERLGCGQRAWAVGCGLWAVDCGRWATTQTGRQDGRWGWAARERAARLNPSRGPGRGCTGGAHEGQTALHRPWAQWAPRWSGREINVKHPTPPAASPLPALLHARPWACFERRRQGQGLLLVQAYWPRVRYVPRTPGRSIRRVMLSDIRPAIRRPCR
jgi:hypothetical protein